MQEKVKRRYEDPLIKLCPYPKAKGNVICASGDGDWIEDAWDIPTI